MTYTYTPHGVCSRKIVIDIDENTNTIKTRLYKALDKLKLKLRDDEE